MHKLALSLTPDSAWDESGVRDKPGKKAHKALWIDICATFTSIIKCKTVRHETCRTVFLLFFTVIALSQAACDQARVRLVHSGAEIELPLSFFHDGHTFMTATQASHMQPNVGNTCRSGLMSFVYICCRIAWFRNIGPWLNFCLPVLSDAY